jgi:signal peptide peptidase SppA
MSDAVKRYTQITKAVYERPWALQPAMLAVIEEIVRLRAAGSAFTSDEIDQRVAAAANGPRRGGLRAQGVAVIPMYGVISKRMDLMSAMSGGTSVDQLTSQFRDALADPEVGAILFDVDSPGGSVEGITELANEIRAARGQKPMAAVANPTMASAAYWLSSQVDEVIASPSAIVGSIGVIGMHVDVSAQDEMLGEKVTLITAGEGKANGNEHEPLTDEARAELQAMADDYYGLFVGDVAAARGVKATQVTGNWKASAFTAKKAQAAGLVDRVETLDEAVGRMVGKINAPFGVGALSAADAPRAIGVLMATLPIHEQAALWTSERDRIAAHYAERERLRAKEGRPLSAQIEERLEALKQPLPDDPSPLVGIGTGGTVDTDLDTDQPEEADPPVSADWRGHARFDVLEAAARGSYALAPREVSPS